MTWGVVEVLFEKNKFVQTLFFAHLTLEKLCKAHWVRCNENKVPPKTHHLVKLLNATDLNIEVNDLNYLDQFNEFQIEGRYPEYQYQLHKKCNKEFTKFHLEKVNNIRQCLLKML